MLRYLVPIAAVHVLALAAVIPAIFSWTALVTWGVFVRTVLVWHITWSVNSLTHMFGYRNHETGENSRNNWLVALFACGEGWHNNHHSDPARCSVSQRWWELDVSHLEARALSFVGITWDIVPGRDVRRARAVAAHASAGSSKT